MSGFLCNYLLYLAREMKNIQQESRACPESGSENQ